MALQDELLDYCLEKPGAYPDFPFGDESLLVKIAGHYFAILAMRNGKYYLSVKGEPGRNLFWRDAYPGTVLRGWHCPPAQQPYNNTIELCGKVPKEKLLEMIDEAYGYTFKKLTKREREALDAKPPESETSCFPKCDP